VRLSVPVRRPGWIDDLRPQHDLGRRTQGSDWASSYLARARRPPEKARWSTKSSRPTARREAVGGEEGARSGEKDGVLEGGARMVNHLTRPEEFGGEARRAGYKLGGSLKTWERAASTAFGPSSWRGSTLASRAIYARARARNGRGSPHRALR
jgi:hypothetical protein